MNNYDDLFTEIKNVHEQYIKEQNRLEDEIDLLRREVDGCQTEEKIEALNRIIRINDIKRKMVVEFIHSLDKIVEH